VIKLVKTATHELWYVIWSLLMGRFSPFMVVSVQGHGIGEHRISG
jgi:hypothetical protein